MTADNTQGPEGAEQPPAEDDPFAYLYRSEGGDGEGAPGRAPGVPRTPYTRPMEVGRAQYGAPPQHQGPGYRPPYPQQPRGPYGPGAEATTQLPQPSRYAERSRPQPGEEAPRGRGKGPVIGVVAVVAAIAIGSGIALSGNDGKKDNAAPPAPAPATSAGGHSPSASAGGSSSASSAPSGSPSPGSFTGAPAFLDASAAQPQNATSATSVKGAISADGSYLTMPQGSSATFTVNVATAGTYSLWLHYNNSSGSPVHVAVAVNGQDHQGGTTFKSWGDGDPTKAWSYTYIWPQFQAGSNTVTVSVPGGGPVLLDQVAITSKDLTGSYPSPGAAGGSAAG
ncbi:hypothetical protein [Kitasatospora sp. LaBMicrA B282]|uniref:hypothetical protein n=1 Tax=Kitasatospora sp. LaBMicrA B282 TaxID=3420949 RepID=UPI003D0B1671